MKQILTNAEIVQRLRSLKPCLSQRNLLGYVAARNYRVLSNALLEYEQFKNNLIQKYGEQDKDENGNLLPTVTVRMDSENFEQFCKELEPLNNVTQEVDLMTAKYESVVGILSGEEILAIDWLLEE